MVESSNAALALRLLMSVEGGGDVVPVGGAGVALLTRAAVKGDGGYAAGRAAVVFGAEDEAVNELLGCGLFVFGASADLDGDGCGAGDAVHAAEHLFELVWAVHERRTGSFAIDEVDGTADVEVDETEAAG